MYKQAGKTTDCDECDGRCPDLMPGNRRIFSLLCAIQTQWRVGMGGAIGLDYPAVYQTAAMLGIKINPVMLTRIRAVERQALEAMSDGKE